MKDTKEERGGGELTVERKTKCFVCDHSQEKKTGYKEGLYHNGRDVGAYLPSI